MPLIEELPVSGGTRISHGWAYVPDTGATVTAAQPSSRKRGRDGNIASAASNAQAAHKLSAKQEKAIQQRLNDLGKENHREIHIAIPKRETAAGTAARAKSTPNVRRILGYSRTFQHYLADEEAGVNVYGAAAAIAAGASGGASASTAASSKNTDARKRTETKTSAQKRTSSVKETRKAGSAAPPPTTKGKRGGRTRGNAATNAVEGDGDIEMIDAPPSPAANVKKETTTEVQQNVQQQGKKTETQQQAIYDPALDKDPLLKTRDVPKPPTERVMQALLAEPMLSYNAARAKPLQGADNPEFEIRTGSSVLMAKPQRWFCSVCGYWGKVRCRHGCGERVCGLLECWRGHEGVCALAGY
ncbi:hypothetical protein PV08_05630 [Exophiala spinifera]|uniref:HIT-type domain-containing protein n=1 Tax=Exophiala spinifera TaxID=91928 RepID=A0A0D1ZS23_9EURO|nr:uncharacterized protein PV08_05630 [Exophiala spinifera]KIW15582.1 hypothetical protein PV08_05630 [Exophiala spinifera]